MKFKDWLIPKIQFSFIMNSQEIVDRYDLWSFK